MRGWYPPPNLGLSVFGLGAARPDILCEVGAVVMVRGYSRYEDGVVPNMLRYAVKRMVLWLLSADIPAVRKGATTTFADLLGPTA